ncbi:MAG TPA: hypothetical protein VGC83_17465 [Solirubrobacteraceae bacterium]|jgi:hypothetical protein
MSRAVTSEFAGIVTCMSSQRERAEEKRKEKLKAVEEQVAEGSLTIRQMTPEERAKYPKRERPPQTKRKRY